jgi:D-aspartate ligase
MQVLVINCSRNGLAVIRALGEKKVEVIAADHKYLQPGLHSKYVKSYFLMPSVLDEDLFIEKMTKIGRDEFNKSGEKTILMPVNDVYLLIFNKYWHRLKGFFTPAFETDMQILLSCVDKYKSSKMANQLCVAIPNTLYSPLMESDISGISYPVVVKPALGNSIENKKNNVFRLKECSSYGDLLNTINSLNEQGVKYIVQEYVPGGDNSLYTVGVSAVNGDIHAIFTGRKLRQFPPKFGQCSYGETVINADLAVKYSKALIKKSGFTGIAQIEYKKHQEDFYLMEINPRSWSWISLSTYSGVNLPYCLYISLQGLKLQEFKQVRSGTWMYSLMDFKHNVLSGKISIFVFVKSFFTSSCHAHFQFKDKVPFLFYIYSLIGAIIKACSQLIYEKLRKLKNYV